MKDTVKKLLALTLALGMTLSVAALAGNTLISANTETRAKTVLSLYELEGEPAFMNDNIFTDVPSGAAYEKAVIWANGKAIVKGYGDGRFGPSDAVTLEQFLTILYRYACYKEYDVSVGEDSNILSYDDAFSIASYAVPAVQWAEGAGIAPSRETMFLPKDAVTSEEAEAMFDAFRAYYGAAPVSPLGGWTLTEEEAVIPADAKEALDAALNGMTGVGYTPVAYLGSQVVAGTNYAFLCKATVITREPVTKLVRLTVYRDLSGAASVTAVEDVALTDFLQDADLPFTPALCGGWTLNDQAAVLPEDVQSAFDKAFTGMVGVGYTPLAYLGSQVVSGINYAVLCRAVTVTAQPAESLAVVVLSEDVQGNVSVASVAPFAIH